MKKFFFFIVVLTSNILCTQTKYYTKLGIIYFEASVPSFEQINAVSKTGTCVLNTSTGEIAALALTRGFRFKVALMEEHFNENYAESSTFPKVTFAGEINNFSIEDLDTEPKTFNLNGKLTFHGKTIIITPKINLFIKENKIHLTSTFIVKPEDFDIKIPKIVRKKVSETVKITINFILVSKS